MIEIQSRLKIEIKNAFQILFDYACDSEKISIDETPKNYSGFYTLIIFPHLKYLKLSPQEVGEKVGNFLIKETNLVSDFNVVQGFLNLDLSESYLLSIFKIISEKKNKSQFKRNGEEVMVEFSSPNTNKPLHLGHLRNIFLGDSVSRILEHSGSKVYRVQIINDRGIHICKSMVAWKHYSNNKTPNSEKIKGDKFVGEYYVKFEKENQIQIQSLIKKGFSQEDAKKNTPLVKEAQELLKLWESKDPSTLKLWKEMNDWVYEGFASTYNSIGVSFDKNYFESETYILGKRNIDEGLKKNIFYKKEDGSVWVDLVDDGLDNKILMRSDGTSVYMTQDIGTAIKRFEDFPNIKKQIYTVGNEQDYHFKVLFKILEKLDYSWAKECYHLSYGMIDLPDGKMKSREGKVVDADDLISHMIHTAKDRTEELGKNDEFDSKNSDELYKKIAIGALKYYLLRVDPKKKMLFNPEESIDFNGNTGPFIQYTYARIRSIIKRADTLNIKYEYDDFQSIQNISEIIKRIINHLNSFTSVIKQASVNFSPSILCQYVYELSKLYNSFYQDEKIIKKDNDETTSFKIALSVSTSIVIKDSLELLGIEVLDKM